MRYLEILIENQAKLVATSFILGLIFGAVYDIIRLSYTLCGLVSFAGKKPVERKGILPSCARFFGDLLWTSALGVCFAVYLYAANDGQFRWFIPASAACGFALWQAGPGRLSAMAADKLTRLMRAFFRAAVLVPLTAFARLIQRAARAVGGVLAAIGRGIWRATGKRALVHLKRTRALKRTEAVRVLLRESIQFGEEEGTEP